jgi:AcrR family transcriptional regulator
MGVQEAEADEEGVADNPRERILSTAYELFCQHGLHAIGVDRITAEASVAKTTLYRNFSSKEELVLSVLERRKEVWTRGWLEHEVERRAPAGKGRLLAIFDAFDDWFRRDDYESCLFMNCLLESHDATSPIGAASVAGLADVRSLVRTTAQEAGVRDSDGVARQLQMLMNGSIVAATKGDPEAAQRAHNVASLLLEREELGS